MRLPVCPTIASLLLLASAALQLPPLRPAPLAAQAPSVPPDARLLLRRDAELRALAEAARADSPRVGPRASVLALSRGRSGETIVDVFVRAERDVDVHLRALGARVGARAAGWVTARIPVARLEDLMKVEGVRAIELARRASYARTTPSIVDVGADRVRTRVAGGDRFEGSAGRGAVIGFVDTGIDFTHPDFFDDATGRSRVLAIWDQTLEGDGPGDVGGVVFAYGQLCPASTLGRDGTCPSRDHDGHGTHVAGIAAGDGSGTNSGRQDFEFAGVAPAAELIVVKTDLSFASIVDGVDYIFRRAAELGRPAVVNLSLGTQAGPHDGRSAPALMLDALTGRGRIIVAAAGNEGNNPSEGSGATTGSVHGEGQARAAGDSIVLSFVIPPYAPNGGRANDLMQVQAFYDGRDTFSLTVVTPSGARLAVAMNASATSLGSDGGIVAYNGTAAGDSVLGTDLESGSFFPESPTNLAELYLGEWVSGGSPPAAGTWRVILNRLGGAGPGVVDAYLPLSTLSAPPLFSLGASNRRLILTPADGRKIIAVGAYTTIREWTSADGRAYAFLDDVVVGDMLGFSSPGPTRDGRIKPDITAPGRVFSSLSGSSPLSTDVAFEPLIAPDRAHVMLQGTSMSTPHVTGAAALLLAARPSLTPEQLLRALGSTARQDLFTERSYAGDLGTPNNSWGFGKLDVPGALTSVQRLFVTAGERVNLSQNPVRSTPLVVSFEGVANRAGVYDFAGRLVRSFARTELGEARSMQWDLRSGDGTSVANGAYLLVLDLPTGIVRRKIFVAR